MTDILSVENELPAIAASIEREEIALRAPRLFSRIPIRVVSEHATKNRVV